MQQHNYKSKCIVIFMKKMLCLFEFECGLSVANMRDFFHNIVLIDTLQYRIWIATIAIDLSLWNIVFKIRWRPHNNLPNLEKKADQPKYNIFMSNAPKLKSKSNLKLGSYLHTYS